MAVDQSIWKIELKDQEKYTSLFYDLDPEGEYLDGKPHFVF